MFRGRMSLYNLQRHPPSKKIKLHSSPCKKHQGSEVDRRPIFSPHSGLSWAQLKYGPFFSLKRNTKKKTKKRDITYHHTPPASSLPVHLLLCSPPMASPHLASFLSFPKTPPPPPPPLAAAASPRPLTLHRPRPRAASAGAASPPPDGAGPAAPTRGDRFLGRHLAAEAAATVLAPEDAERRRRRKEKRRALARKPPAGLASSCYGCGAPLQTAEEDAPGYVEPATYDLV